MDCDVDVAIIGAGMSGINAAYHLEAMGVPYTIFEARDGIGGTWDLFRYPGIRTDSDAHTFGFYWNPWSEATPFAPGSHILAYMRRSAARHGIDNKIRLQHKVLSANWLSKPALWSLDVRDARGETRTFRTRFVVLSTGYFDYNTPAADIPGLESFAGPVLHPQAWPEDLDYAGRHVVIIGSGATAVSMVPAMAQKAARVTMLQRSPSYFLSLPNRDWLGDVLRGALPRSMACRLNRARWILASYFIYYFCQFFPRAARFLLTKLAVWQLPAGVPGTPHFDPAYGPWDQRLCFCPDGDFFASLRSRRAEIVTGTIKTVTSQTIELVSGQTLSPAIIVTATGLQLKFGGHVKVSVDGDAIDLSRKLMWAGSMLQDVPNLVFVLGYFNATYTLGSDVTCEVLVRILRCVRAKGASAVVPRLEHADMRARPFTSLSSTYFRTGAGLIPRVGKGIWGPRVNYVVDICRAKWRHLTTELQFLKVGNELGAE